MSDQQYQMEKSITALRAAAEAIAAAMEKETISSEEVACLLTTIADRMHSLNNKARSP